MKFRLETTLQAEFQCPEAHCTKMLSYEGVQRILEFGNDRALFEKYDHRLTLQLLEQTAEFVWCAYPDCKSGQFHDTSNSARRRLVCVTCDRQTCSFHRIIWHTGLTCEQYDREQANNNAAKRWIGINTKQCPRCHRNIQKNGGCNQMTCKCRHQFCWECLVDYKLIVQEGLHLHQSTCSHFQRQWNTADR